MNSKSVPTLVLAIFLIQSVAFGAGPTTQGASQTGSATTATTTASKGKLDYDTVCADVSAMQQQLTAAGTAVNTEATQKLEYCNAAKDAKNASKTNGTLTKVWAAVAGVCVTACVMTFMGPAATMQTVCSGASIGGGVTDAVMTKNFMSGLTSIGMGAAGFIFKGGSDATQGAAATAPAPAAATPATGSAPVAGAAPVEGVAAQPAQQAAGQTAQNTTQASAGSSTAAKIMACGAAAAATMQVFTKNSATKNSNLTLQENLTSANAIGPIDNPFGPVKLASVGSNVQNVNITQNGAVRGGASTSTEDPEKKKLKVSGGCDGISPGDKEAAMSCVLASDPNLPGFVKTAAFNNELKDRTGLGLIDFTEKVEDPIQSISDQAEANLPAESAAQVASLMGEAAMAAGVGTAPSTYAGGGAAKPATGGKSGDDDGAALAAVAAKFMKKLTGGAAGEEGEAGDGSNLAFQDKAPPLPSHLRGPASENDVGVSLFDRVTYRYYFVGRRLFYGETSPVRK